MYCRYVCVIDMSKPWWFYESISIAHTTILEEFLNPGPIEFDSNLQILNHQWSAVPNIFGGFHLMLLTLDKTGQIHRTIHNPHI